MQFCIFLLYEFLCIPHLQNKADRISNKKNSVLLYSYVYTNVNENPTLHIFIHNTTQLPKVPRLSYGLLNLFNSLWWTDLYLGPAVQPKLKQIFKWARQREIKAIRKSGYFSLNFSSIARIFPYDRAMLAGQDRGIEKTVLKIWMMAFWR